MDCIVFGRRINQRVIIRTKINGSLFRKLYAFVQRTGFFLASTSAENVFPLEMFNTIIGSRFVHAVIPTNNVYSQIRIISSRIKCFLFKRGQKYVDADKKHSRRNETLQMCI